MLNEDIFETFPILETKRLILRQLTPNDVPVMFENYSNPQVMRYWSAPPMRMIEEAWRRFYQINNIYRAHQGIHWAITLKDQPQMIGMCSHWQINKQHCRSEIGYDLAPTYWGQGIVAEAVAATLQLGFERVGLHSIEAQIEPNNHASRRVLEKLGFKQEGYFRENFCVDGIFSDTAVFSLLRSEWQDR